MRRIDCLTGTAQSPQGLFRQSQSPPEGGLLNWQWKRRKFGWIAVNCGHCNCGQQTHRRRQGMSSAGCRDNPRSAARTAPFKKEPFALQLLQSPLFERGVSAPKMLPGDCRGNRSEPINKGSSAGAAFVFLQACYAADVAVYLLLSTAALEKDFALPVPR